MAKPVFTKKVESAEIVNFNKIGESYTGVFIECKEVDQDEGKNSKKAYLFQFYQLDDKGEANTDKLYGFWGSQLLTDLMKQVNPGQFFRVTFKSQKAATQKGYSPTKQYSVEIAE